MCTRTLMLPIIELPPPERDGVAVLQRMLTEGDSAIVPESSMVIDFADAACAKIMVSARPKKKSCRATSGAHGALIV